MSDGTEFDEEIAQILGTRVRSLRQLAKMTQDDLCEKTGIFRTYLSRIENGIANPTVTVLSSLAGALKVEPWELLRERGPVSTGFTARVVNGRRALPRK